MNLIELKDYLKDVSLRHKDVKSFEYGSDFDIAANKKDVYPQIFLELPFLIDFNLESNPAVDDVTIAFNVLVNIAADDIEADFNAISYAKDIGDMIVNYINETCDDFKISSTSSLSLREHSDDSVAGMRYDLVLQLPRPCVLDYNEIFNLE